MKIYDSVINETLKSLESYNKKTYKPNPSMMWKDEGKSELVMQREAAYELGGSGLEAANYTCVTTSDIINEDEIVVIGPDLNELKADAPFARVSIIKTSEALSSAPDSKQLSAEQKEEQNRAYNAVRNLEFVRYHVYPKGYMIRVSTTSYREQIRVSKKALEAGITFAKVGSLYIKHYKDIPGVVNVKVIFVTEPSAVKALAGNAKKVEGITKTLDHILDGIDLDCGHCTLKPVCDEVEGMREEHMKALGIKPKE